MQRSMPGVDKMLRRDNTMMMNAVAIESCRVMKLFGDGPLALRVLEADRVLFEQQISIIGEELFYIR